MAPSRNSAAIKSGATAPYEARNWRTIAKAPKLSEWAPVNNNKEWQNNRGRLYSYLDAAKHCDSFIHSADYARSLDPTVDLDYIRMSERYDISWKGDVLDAGHRGLMTWVGRGARPETDEEVMRTKLFVAGNCVADKVYDVVMKSMPGRVKRLHEQLKKSRDTWTVPMDDVVDIVEQAIIDWKDQVPAHYHEPVNKLSIKEVYDLISSKKMSETDF